MEFCRSRHHAKESIASSLLEDPEIMSRRGKCDTRKWMLLSQLQEDMTGAKSSEEILECSTKCITLLKVKKVKVFIIPHLSVFGQRLPLLLLLLCLLSGVQLCVIP